MAAMLFLGKWLGLSIYESLPKVYLDPAIFNHNVLGHAWYWSMMEWIKVPVEKVQAVLYLFHRSNLQIVKLLKLLLNNFPITLGI